MDKYEKYLNILGLDESADLKDIKSAYRKLVKIHYPDLYNSDENKEKASKNFKIITEAFDYLRDNYTPINNNKKSSFKKDTSPNRFNQYKTDDNDYLVKLIKDCIKTQTRIKITYISSTYYEQKRTTRVIIPMELHLGSELNNDIRFSDYNYDDYKMYLRAYCELRKDYRTFRLDRITNAQIYKEPDTVTTDIKEHEKFDDNSIKSIDNKRNKNSGCLWYFITVLIILFFIINHLQ